MEDDTDPESSEDDLSSQDETDDWHSDLHTFEDSQFGEESDEEPHDNNDYSDFEEHEQERDSSSPAPPFRHVGYFPRNDDDASPDERSILWSQNSGHEYAVQDANGLPRSSSAEHPIPATSQAQVGGRDTADRTPEEGYSSANGDPEA